MEAEAGHDGEAATDIDRITASVTYHRASVDNVMWANTVGWGRNVERGGGASNALLLESSVTVRERDAWYGRFEWAAKSGHDLAVSDDGLFNVAKLQGGYTRYLPAWKGVTPGVGAAVSAGIVPRTLAPSYGGRVTPGFGVYLTVTCPL